MLRFFPFKVLQRHILWEVLRNFLLCASFLLSLMLLGRGIQMRNLMVNLDLSVLDFLSVLVFMAPMTLLLVIPLSCMLATFLSFLRMSTDREMVALRASGVSITQMLPAPLIFAVICCFFTGVISIHGIAWGVERFRSTVLELAQSKARLNMQPGVFNQDIAGITLYARTIDPLGNMTRIIFEDEKNKADSRTTILAPRGRMHTDERRGELIFDLQDGRMYKLDKGNVSILDFNEYIIRIDLSTLMQDKELSGLKPKEMSWEALQDAHQRYLAGEDITAGHRMEPEMQKRLSLPVACIILTLFSIPLAASFENAKKQIAIVLSMVSFLLYYVLFSVGVALAEGEMLPAAVAMWMPNVIFGVLAIWGLFLTSRERLPDVSSVTDKLKKKFFSRSRVIHDAS